MSALHRILIACSLIGALNAYPQSAVTRSGVSLELPAATTDAAIVEFRERARAPESDAHSLIAATEERRRTLETDLGRIAATARVRRMYTRVFNGAAVTIPRAAWDEVAKLPYVKRVVPDPTVHAFLSSSVPQIGAPQLWQAHGTRGSGVVIAIIDTGVDYRHPALGGGFGPGFKVKGGWDFVNNDADPMDDFGHGTHVAGITAASSPTITGVAPDATLLAYKVLDSTGNGEGSNVIAAIDRAIDPDGDGDISDAADVINLSLGGPGSPDDPVAQAVENAITNGVVVVAAAGNDFDYFHIGSPASAPHAITVGAAERNGTIAFFSSKGPNTQLYTIKPEVVAPGVGIVSTWLGGGTAALNGTSMAAPHVAGAAALLLAVHPDWTPAEVKSALVSTAVDLNDDVMAQGAGRIDVSKAVDATLFLDPATLGFGLADVEHDVWSPSLPVRITNHGTSAITLGEPSSVTSGAAVPQWAMTATGTTLAPGESKDVAVTMTVDHRASPYPTAGSLSYAGVVSLAGVPTKWAFVKASRIRIRTEEGTPVGFVSDDHQRYRVQSGGVGIAESILPAGTYDVVTWISYPNEGRLAVSEHLEVKGTAEVLITTSSLRHVITPAGVDENGVLLTSRERLENVSEYKNRLRLVYPAANLNSYFDTAFLDVARFRTTDIPPTWRLLVGEFYADSPSKTVYGVQHLPLAGVHDDVLLQGPPVHEQPVRVIVPGDPGETSQVALGSTKHDRYPDRTVLEPTTHAVSDALLSPWDGHIYVTPDVDTTYGFSPSIGLKGTGSRLEDFEATPLRLFPDGRTAVVRGVEAGPATQWYAAGEVVTLGGGPVHPRIDFTPLSQTQLALNFFFYGSNGERRWRDIFSTHWAAFNAAGQSIGSGALDSSNLLVQLPAPGPMRLELVDDRSIVGGQRGVATFRTWTDTTRTDDMPPSLSALSVQNNEGAQLDVVSGGGDAWLLFGIMDQQFTTNGREYKPIPTSATRVDYRISGNGAWIAAQPQLVVEDILMFPAGRASDGAVYRCRIPALGATMDVRITAEDSAGNKSEYTLEPAFAVKLTPRTRAVRH